jgi:hypothetical protein
LFSFPAGKKFWQVTFKSRVQHIKKPSKSPCRCNNRITIEISAMDRM